jgi:hypothetical protein
MVRHRRYCGYGMRLKTFDPSTKALIISVCPKTLFFGVVQNLAALNPVVSIDKSGVLAPDRALQYPDTVQLATLFHSFAANILFYDVKVATYEIPFSWQGSVGSR